MNMCGMPEAETAMHVVGFLACHETWFLFITQLLHKFDVDSEDVAMYWT